MKNVRRAFIVKFKTLSQKCYKFEAFVVIQNKKY